MRIVVDTNIVFSAMLNTNSRISRILLQPKSQLNFYSTEQLLIEIKNHADKLKAISGYSDSEIGRISMLFNQKIRFINVKLIPKKIYKKSFLLTEDIDDTEFVALTEHVNGKLWSGDKELRKGLTKRGWNNFISTEDLFKIIKKRQRI